MLLDHLRGITKFVLPNSCYQGLKVLVANAVLTVSTNSWAKNVRYDRDTRLIMKNLLDTHSNAIDIGASVGDFTDELVRIIKRSI